MPRPEPTNADQPAPGRSRRNRGSEVVYERLVDAAITEFGARGFEGASTRRIATAADAHQSQIKYHFETKEGLWRQCLETLLNEVNCAVAEQSRHFDDDARSSIEAWIRGFVAFAAKRPELNRIMMHEASSDNSRLKWLVETKLGGPQADLRASWTELLDAGMVSPIDPDLIYHTVIGAASLIYANGPEAVLMGIDPTDPDLVRRHADALVAVFLGD